MFTSLAHATLSSKRLERGFLLGPLLPYLLVAVVAVGILGTTYYRGREAGKEVIRAELQPLLTACEGRVSALGTQIEAQNAAVKAQKAVQDAKVAKATQGMQAARSVAHAAQAEAERLREAMLAPVGEGCPAAEAVRKIREGLSK